eukprot:CAMPEP_0117057118 /NCGR_PEP_ID=MMETSP0472-20121206/39641_1 /TAXON_ID=693140 ORGANISM="Tiarina fusus, Strain LIS" /NCGR_SAMPLE_ID=MMETSP0472 /ASSEMBLY_ACC=CAM_ASM_000603 /LENGTH=256 /DNA_ID=CAMNT_0004773853 /DNA_START=3 /DNA_END=769 /DNA_ORIENTATION=+
MSNSEDEKSDQSQSGEQEEEQEEQQEEQSEEEITPEITEKERKKQQKLRRDAERFKEDQDNRGIIYISKVPPFMKPEKVRYIMSQFGEVDRIYLTAESSERKNARKKRGGTKKTCYLDGWVEFKDKKIAKRVALTLNATKVGGNKRNFHAEFIWNIRYLSKFKWNHLTEHKRRKDQTRQDKVRTILSEAKRENDVYMQRVDAAKMITAMENKKKEEKQEKIDTKKTETLARKQLEDLRSKFRQRDTIEDTTPVKQT